MALHPNDLFVIQSQDNNVLYSLKLSDLDTYLEGSTGIQFKGSVDLNNAPNAQLPDPITLPASNGDLYIVESDANVIAAGWVMANGETAASENDRIIYDADDNGWVLVSGGTSTGGTVTEITASLPLKSDGDPVTPVLTIRAARTTTKATDDGDGEGTAGSVAKLAEATDVSADGTGDATAVVTADLLKATNTAIEDLTASAGGVQTVTTTDANGNAALQIAPTSNNVVIEIKTADGNNYGVTQLATAQDIVDGTAGATAVVDASQLQAALTDFLTSAMQDLTEGGTDIVTGALQIASNADDEYTIGINQDVFVPYDFRTLTDITTV